jgi:hypothetical protein
MPRVGLQPTIPVSERALHTAATVIGIECIYLYKLCHVIGEDLSRFLSLLLLQHFIRTS